MKTTDSEIVVIKTANSRPVAHSKYLHRGMENENRIPTDNKTAGATAIWQ
jgi:hypothetical protein